MCGQHEHIADVSDSRVIACDAGKTDERAFMQHGKTN